MVLVRERVWVVKGVEIPPFSVEWFRVVLTFRTHGVFSFTAWELSHSRSTADQVYGTTRRTNDPTLFCYSVEVLWGAIRLAKDA